MEKICVSCNKSLKKLARKNYYWSDEQWYCKACYQIKVKHPSSSTQSVVEENIEQSAIGISSVTLNINRSIISSKCIFGCQSDRVLRRLSREECLNIYIEKDIFVPYNARVCCTHGEKDSFLIPEDFTTYDTRVTLSVEEILAVFKTFKNLVLEERNKKVETRVSFTKMAEEQLLYETGVNHSQFSDILNSVQDVLRNNEFAVGIYLSRLHHGYTFEEIAKRYLITRQTASNYCETVRQHLLERYCSIHLSFNDRNKLITHQTDCAKQLHASTNNQVILVLDGTYSFKKVPTLYFNVYRILGINIGI